MNIPPADHTDTQELIGRARRGDPDARQGLLVRYRERLRGLIAARMDSRLSARVDPSDVVQESLAAAAGDFSDYLDRTPLPLGGWLWQFARDRLADLHRRHLLPAAAAWPARPGARRRGDSCRSRTTGRAPAGGWSGTTCVSVSGSPWDGYLETIARS